MVHLETGRISDSGAIEQLTHVLADCERNLGADHPYSLITRSNLAEAYRKVGRTKEAIELHKRTLADRERILGANHPDTLDSRNKLNATYQTSGQADKEPRRKRWRR